jgi:hypothetical protein
MSETALFSSKTFKNIAIASESMNQKSHKNIGEKTKKGRRDRSDRDIKIMSWLNKVINQ